MIVFTTTITELEDGNGLDVQTRGTPVPEDSIASPGESQFAQIWATKIAPSIQEAMEEAGFGNCEEITPPTIRMKKRE